MAIRPVVPGIAGLLILLGGCGTTAAQMPAAPATQSPASTTQSPAPVITPPAAKRHHHHHHRARHATSTPAPAVTQPGSCYPLTSTGHCYEPGEYCRKTDHGAAGVAGDGEPIVCSDNDGWRWEPA